MGRAFDWLASQQLPDGSWCTFYLPDGVIEPRRDPNVCAYVASGAWWCSQLPGAPEVLERLWPMLERAMSWSLSCQRRGGEIVWSVGADGIPGNFALLAANSSVHSSLLSAARVADALGHERRVQSLAGVGVEGGQRCRRQARSVRPEGPLGHGLVLPGARRGGRR